VTNADERKQRAQSKRQEHEPLDPTTVTWKPYKAASLPTIDQRAFYGPLGVLSEVMAHHTGLDRIGLYGASLLMAGNALGPDVTTRLDNGPVQHAQMGLVEVGDSTAGKDRIYLAAFEHLMCHKPGDVEISIFSTTGWGYANRHENVKTGEAVVHLVRDPKDSNDTTAPMDTRAFLLDREFTRLLKGLNERDSTLSEICRQSFDGTRLGNTTKTAALNDKATNAHISWLGLSTDVALRMNLHDVSLSDGLGNRFCFLLIAPSVVVDSSPAAYEAEMDPLLRPFHEALADARRRALPIPVNARAAELLRRMERGVTARLKPFGLVGMQEARFMPHVMRFALVLAALDGTTAIRSEHVIAAAFLRLHMTMCNRYLFGDRTGMAVGDEILTLLRQAMEPATRTHIHNAFGRNVPVSRLVAALDHLQRVRLIVQGTGTSTAAGGRPPIVYRLAKEEVSTVLSCDSQGLNALLDPVEQSVLDRLTNGDAPVIADDLPAEEPRETHEKTPKTPPKAPSIPDPSDADDITSDHGGAA
jgi:hypothetical protein